MDSKILDSGHNNGTKHLKRRITSTPFLAKVCGRPHSADTMISTKSFSGSRASCSTNLGVRAKTQPLRRILLRKLQTKNLRLS